MASASELEKGKYFLFNDEPVKVTRKEIVTVGTHCHTKLKVFFQGLNSKGEKMQTFSHGDKVEMLDIQRKQAQVVSKSNGKMQIMDIATYETHDAVISPELYDELTDEDMVSFIEFRGQIKVVDKR